MKLRISGNSIRFRFRRSEVERLRKGMRIEDTLYLGDEDTASLTYAVESSTGLEVTVRFLDRSIVAGVPAGQLQAWAASEQVGIYATLQLGSGRPLELVIEKDFACLDASDADNADTFLNPHAGSIC